MKIYLTIKRYRFDPPTSYKRLAQQIKQGNISIIKQEPQQILLKFQNRTFLITLDTTGKFVNLRTAIPLTHFLLPIILPILLIILKLSLEKYLNQTMNEILSWGISAFIIIGIIYQIVFRFQKIEKDFILEFEKYVLHTNSNLPS